MKEETQIAVITTTHDGAVEHYAVKKDGRLFYVRHSIHDNMYVEEKEFETVDTENPLPIDLKIIDAIDKYIMNTVSNGKSAEVNRSETL